MNLIGTEIYHSDVQSDLKMITIDLSNFPKGAYFVVSTSMTGERIINRIMIE